MDCGTSTIESTCSFTLLAGSKRVHTNSIYHFVGSHELNGKIETKTAIQWSSIDYHIIYRSLAANINYTMYMKVEIEIIKIIAYCIQYSIYRSSLSALLLCIVQFIISQWSKNTDRKSWKEIANLTEYWISNWWSRKSGFSTQI